MKRSRITWPGAFGAIMDTSTSGDGTTWLKWMLKPWANMRVLPLPRAPLIDSSYTCRWVWSGSRIMMISPACAASVTVMTLTPSVSALAQLLDPSYSPTTTSWPESLRFSAWACPWLPYPMMAIRLPRSSPRSASWS